jgi:glycosyltransferase involved in cell wall biosynthesis
MATGTVWVVIPAYNEELAIAQVVESVCALYPNVVVVDDGSSDNTQECAADAGAVVVRHPFNLGQGAALQTGIRYALAKNADFVVTFDGDGQHLASDISVLLEPLSEGKADIVFGSRFLGQAKQLPLTRRLLLQAARVVTVVSAGVWMSDAHNGLRALNRRSAENLRIRQNGMAHASEIVEQVAHLGLRFVEVPVVVSYTTYSLAKGQRFWGAFGILADIIGGRLLR